MMRKIRQFMYGRYGNDSLNFALVIFGCVLTVILSLFNIYSLRLIGTVPYIIALLRALSKNREKRYMENERFMTFFAPVRKALMTKIAQKRDREHKYYKCPDCRKTLRVPKGRGKIKISCPHCSKEFVRKT